MSCLAAHSYGLNCDLEAKRYTEHYNDSCGCSSGKAHEVICIFALCQSLCVEIKK